MNLDINTKFGNISKSKEKYINFSIDNLTIVANFKRNDLFYLFVRKYVTNSENNDTISKDSKNDFFEFSFMIKEKIFCQIDRISNKVRLEFNPNKIDNDIIEEINFILSNLINVHFTRLDLAIDLYNYKLEDYTIIDIGNRKKAYFYSRTNSLETFYSGSNKSSKYIRIYNKAKEQKIDNLDWWRFELQLRDVYIEKYQNGLDTFYKDIFVFKYSCIDNLPIETIAMIEYLLHDITRLDKLSKNAKTKYKKYIRELELRSIDFFDDVLSLTEERVNNYLQYICERLSLPRVLL